MAKIDLARALKERAYFDSLSADDQHRVRSASPIGSGLSDRDLETVSGGLEGGREALASTTTTTQATHCAVCDASVAIPAATGLGDPPPTCCC